MLVKFKKLHPAAVTPTKAHTSDAGYDLADSAVRKSIELLRQTKLYRHKVKKACGDALRAYDAYQRRLMEVLHNSRQFWLDLADCYTERMQPHVTKLDLAIRQRMMDLGERPDRIPLLSSVMLASVLLDIAVNNHHAYFRSTADRIGINIAREFTAADLTGVRRHYRIVCDAVLSDGSSTTIDFADDARCKLALDCVINQMHLPDLINSAGLDALRLNPDKVPDDICIDDLTVVDGIITDPNKD